MDFFSFQFFQTMFNIIFALCVVVSVIFVISCVFNAVRNFLYPHKKEHLFVDANDAVFVDNMQKSNKFEMDFADVKKSIVDHEYEICCLKEDVVNLNIYIDDVKNKLHLS